MRKIIKGGTLVTESGLVRTDILVNGEKIEALGMGFNYVDAEVVDASGMLVMPGGVDAHVHLDLPMPNTTSSDDHFTGTRAAAFGGTTTVMDFANHDKPSLVESFHEWNAKAEPNVAVDYAIHSNFTRFNAETLAEIKKMPELGVNSIKMFTAYNGRMRLQDDQIFQAMREAKEYGVVSMIHAENGDLIELEVAEALKQGHTEPVWHAKTRSADGAASEFLNVCMLAKAAGNAPLYVVHMNNKGEAELLKYAKEMGVSVKGETCPQYLSFTMDDMTGWNGAKFVCSPPMRKEADKEALWKAIQEGTMDTIATDHCPFMFDGSKEIMYDGKPFRKPGKELGKDDFTKIPNGQPGIEDRLPVMWTKAVNSGKITPERFVQLMCAEPAKLFGLYPKKGALLPGSDADIAIWDPNKVVNYGVAVAHMRTDYNLYEGTELRGFPIMVFLRGTLIVDHGEWKGTRGGGQLLKCTPVHY